MITIKHISTKEEENCVIGFSEAFSRQLTDKDILNLTDSGGKIILGRDEDSPFAVFIYFRSAEFPSLRFGLTVDYFYIDSGHRNTGIVRSVLQVLAQIAMRDGLSYLKVKGSPDELKGFFPAGRAEYFRETPDGIVSDDKLTDFAMSGCGC